MKTSYKPLMSAKRAKRILEWHEVALKDNSSGTGDVTVSVLGRKFVVPSDVFTPAPMEPLLGKAVLKEVKETDRVLDMGTGSGLNAILAASKSSNVVAVDVNPSAILTTKENAKLNGVESRIEVFESDLFQNVKGKFDLIIFDPPFRWFKPRNMRERATADENYQTLTTFFKVVKTYLKPNGRILIFFGTSGDISYLRQLIKEAGFDKKIMEKYELTRELWKVTYFVYKLTIK